MKQVLVILLFLCMSFSYGQQKNRNNNKEEAFSIWVSPSFVSEDLQMGINMKLSYQIETFMSFAIQGTFFHPLGQKEGYWELRQETGFYFQLAPNATICPFLFLGYNKGAWKRTWEIENELFPYDVHIDSSPSFGGGVNVKTGKHNLVLEHHYMPSIYQNYSSIGMQFRFYRSKTKKRSNRNR